MPEVDGCVPLFASPETLIKTLDLVTIEGARVVVTASATRSAIRPSPKGIRHVIHKRVPTRPRPAAPNTGPNRSMWPPFAYQLGLQQMAAAKRVSNGHEGDTHWAPPPQNHSRLSQREAHILDGLVQGYTNKVIARSCATASRGDGQGPHEIDLAEDPGSEPHPSGYLGTRAWPFRPSVKDAC